MTDVISPRRLNGYAAIPAAALGGFAMDLASPALSWWPAALLGVGLITLAVWQQRAWVGCGLGALAGATYWLPHLSWLTLYLGPVPWLALGAVMIGWFALFGMSGAAASRSLAVQGAFRGWNGRTLIFAQSLAVSGLWVTREQLQSVWPYGGFAWGRLAHTQAEGPLVALASWLGVAGLSGLLAFSCVLLVGVAMAPTTLRATFGLRTGAAAVCVCGLLALCAFVPPASIRANGTIRVAAVQGNSQSGIFDERENGEVFRDHLAATEMLLEQLEAAKETVDVIVWPENSGEFQLPEQPGRVRAVQKLVERAAAPLVLGSVLQDQDGRYTNSSLVVDERGVTELRYDKRNPVPFAEYMPNRAFFRALAPELVDLVQLDYAFGERPPTLPITIAHELDPATAPASTVEPDSPGRTPHAEHVILAGVAICFDIIFDEHARAMLESGAQLILAQTNNADFGRTDESAQQLQIARLQAVVTGRALVNISTVGTSAIVLPDGSDVQRLQPFTADAMVAEVPLRAGLTPAMRYGGWYAAAWMGCGCVGIAAGVAGWLRARRAGLRGGGMAAPSP